MSPHQLAGYARRRWGTSVYLAVAKSMEQENLYFHTFQPSALDRLVVRLQMSDEWQVVYENADAIILRVR